MIQLSLPLRIRVKAKCIVREHKILNTKLSAFPGLGAN